MTGLCLLTCTLLAAAPAHDDEEIHGVSRAEREALKDAGTTRRPDDPGALALSPERRAKDVRRVAEAWLRALAADDYDGMLANEAEGATRTRAEDVEAPADPVTWRLAKHVRATVEVAEAQPKPFGYVAHRVRAVVAVPTAEGAVRLLGDKALGPLLTDPATREKAAARVVRELKGRVPPLEERRFELAVWHDGARAYVVPEPEHRRKLFGRWELGLSTPAR